VLGLFGVISRLDGRGFFGLRFLIKWLIFFLFLDKIPEIMSQELIPIDIKENLTGKSKNLTSYWDLQSSNNQ